MKIKIHSVTEYDKRPTFDRTISIEGACGPDGKWKKGWHPKGPGQWFVKHISIGRYVVYHNLNRLDYATSFRIVGGSGSVEVVRTSDVNIEIKTSQNGVLTDASFHFCMSIGGGDA